MWKNITYNGAFWIPSALLIAIALAQLVESHMGTLTPWKGGGFGMFSTYDSAGNRFVKAYLVGRDFEIPIKVPSKFSDAETLLLTYPTEATLNALCTDITHLYWFKGHTALNNLESKAGRAMYPAFASSTDRPKATLWTDAPLQISSDHERIEPRSVRLEVWHTVLDGDGTMLRAEMWMSAAQSFQGSEPK